VARPRDPLPTRVESCPELPPEYHDGLDAALATLGVVIDPLARRAIDGHVRILLAWNSAINLTSVRDPDQIAIRHVADSLAALPALAATGIEAFLDLGSGGGYPGLPLAAAMPQAEALLVDSVGKKARFLGVAIEAVGLADRVRVGSVRAEALAGDRRHRERWPGVTARAVAPLAELIELAFPLLVPGGILVAWKKADIETELAAARRAMDGLGGGSIEVRTLPNLDAGGLAVAAADVAALGDHRLVLVHRGRQAIPDAYPRDPASRRRRPW
jgi:16S rRNA (guanine527-N7)-methyltransferase